LLELKRGWNVPRQACLERLSDREFIEEDDHGTLRVTVKGRVALLLDRPTEDPAGERIEYEVELGELTVRPTTPA
jgi:hypothetical protein